MANRSEKERAWAESWRRAGARLSRLRRTDLRAVSTEQTLLRLADAFESCRVLRRPAPTSGLVEQQRWFAKLRP